jgi:hypothetical protein
MSVINDGVVDSDDDSADSGDDNKRLIDKNDCNNEICITCKRKIYKNDECNELGDIVIPVDTLKFDGKCTFDYKHKQQSIWQKIKKVFRC